MCKIYLLKDTKNSKLDNEYSGPHKITQIPNDLNLFLDLGNGKRKIVHTNKLRPQIIKIFHDQDMANSAIVNE